MAKKIDAYIKLQVPAGQANPSPPVGPALGQHGVNIMDFCKAFNAETQSLEPGIPIPVVITVYGDKSFTFIKKTPPASVLLRKAAGISKGSGVQRKTQGHTHSSTSYLVTFQPALCCIKQILADRWRMGLVGQFEVPYLLCTEFWARTA